VHLDDGVIPGVDSDREQARRFRCRFLGVGDQFAGDQDPVLHAAGKPGAQSCAPSALTALNLERGSLDRALMYAREGIRLREVPEAQHAWMRVRKARALALVRGQQHASRDELESVQAPLGDRGFNRLISSSYQALRRLVALTRLIRLRVASR
jgi:hypothetical protein